MLADIKPLKLINIIVDRNKGKKIVEFLNENGFHLHTGFLGKGTAPSDMLTMMSLGEKEKAIIIFASLPYRIEGLFKDLAEKFGIGTGSGIAFSIPMNSISHIDVVKFFKTLNIGGETDNNG